MTYLSSSIWASPVQALVKTPFFHDPIFFDLLGRDFGDVRINAGKTAPCASGKAVLFSGWGKAGRVDVRILTATNKNLEDEVKRGKFREDLFYRIYVIPIRLSPYF